MLLKVLTLGGIALLLVLRLLRGRFGATLLGVSVRALNIVYLLALVVTGIVAGLLEQWVLLGVVAVLLAISGIEEIRRRRSQQTAPPRAVSADRTTCSGRDARRTLRTVPQFPRTTSPLTCSRRPRASELPAVLGGGLVPVDDPLGHLHVLRTGPARARISSMSTEPPLRRRKRARITASA